MRLEDTVVVVTGGSSGIGRQIGLECAREGADVAIGDVTEESKNEGAGPTAEAVRELGREAVFRQVDVSDQAQCEAFVEAAAEELGGIDVLVNNAGAFPQSMREKTVEELSAEEWETLIGINLDGAYNCSKFAMPHIRESDRGRVVNIASKLGIVGHKQAPAYTAAKGGVISLTKQMAVDYADEAITVNVICPGIIETGTKQYRLEQKGERMKRNTLLPYFGSPDDIARATVFLASEDGRFITGHSLVIDGGWTAT
ncbi:MAG: SDR family NAD(P)-dependent oxidoreductase [Halobacteriota archaeon]